MSELAAAGTVAVLRDGANGPEVLLLLRPPRGSFPGSWVFPGGMVEAQDRAEPGRGVEEQHPDAAVAAAVERAAVRETYEEVGLRVSHLLRLSCWTPPEGIPKRVRTWFFVARDSEDPIVAAPDEVVEVRWIRPADALVAHATGNLALMPPTWVTLWGLQGHLTVDALWADISGTVARDGIDEYRTVVLGDDDIEPLGTGAGPLGTGHLFVWEGDERHPFTPGLPGARHRLDTSTRPWQYERPDRR